jgi:hypothetical protein
MSSWSVIGTYGAPEGDLARAEDDTALATPGGHSSWHRCYDGFRAT